MFPIDVVINKEGIIVYLENGYVPGAAMAEAASALK